MAFGMMLFILESRLTALEVMTVDDLRIYFPIAFLLGLLGGEEAYMSL